jgi:hypothetical protein
LTKQQQYKAIAQFDIIAKSFCKRKSNRKAAFVKAMMKKESCLTADLKSYWWMEKYPYHMRNIK